MATPPGPPAMAGRLGLTVRRLREARRLTQGSLATRAQVSQGYVFKLEAGAIREPGLTAVARIAKALGVTVSTLLGE